jgi:hypothetical protein
LSQSARTQPIVAARAPIEAAKWQFHSVNEIKILYGQIFAECPCDSRRRACFGI